MKVLEMSSELGAKGYKSALIKDESKCLNCGFCEAICPEFAIKVLPPVKAKSTKGVLTQ